MTYFARFAFSAAAAGMLATAAFGQDYDPHRYRDQDRHGDQHGDQSAGGGDVIERVFADVQDAASRSFYARRERGRFDHAMRELSKFQNKRRSGRFDRHPLNEAIGELSHLSRANELDPHIRDRMARAADELREFRAAGSYDGSHAYYQPRY